MPPRKAKPPGDNRRQTQDWADGNNSMRRWATVESSKRYNPMIHRTGKNVNNCKLNDFFAHLWRGGGWRFAQAIGADNFRQTHWLPPSAPLGYPSHWNGKANIFFGVNPAAAPVLDKDRAKYPGKADAWIMPRVASKNESVCALNALISEFDGKDFAYPTTDEIAAAYVIVKKHTGSIAVYMPHDGRAHVGYAICKRCAKMVNGTQEEQRALTDRVENYLDGGVQ